MIYRKLEILLDVIQVNITHYCTLTETGNVITINSIINSVKSRNQILNRQFKITVPIRCGFVLVLEQY